MCPLNLFPLLEDVSHILNFVFRPPSSFAFLKILPLEKFTRKEQMVYVFTLNYCFHNKQTAKTLSLTLDSLALVKSNIYNTVIRIENFV